MVSVLGVVVAALVALLVGERDACAQEGAQKRAQESAQESAHETAPESYVYGERRAATETRWYGWQIILVDAATVGIAVAAESGQVAAAGYLGAAPLVHLAHLEPGHAGISLVLRAIAPLAGAALGYGLLSGVECNARSSAGCSAWAAATGIGALSGILTASVIDVALLSTEDVPVDDREPTRERQREREREARRVRILPSAAPTNGGAMAGFTGTF